MKKGISLIEILIVIAIMAIIGLVSATSFLKWKNEKNLDVAVETIISSLEEAKSLTVSAYKGNQYGVYLGQNDKIINFTGSIYDSNDSSNKTTLLPEGVTISTSTLGDSVIFKKSYGTPEKSGFIVLKNADKSIEKTILVESSGNISIKK